MNKIPGLMISLLIGLSAACGSPAQPGGTGGENGYLQGSANAITTITGQPDQTATPGATIARRSSSESLSAKIPQCQGIEPLENAVKFKWPNIEKHLEELKDSNWGYYACEEAPAAVVAYYRKEMKKPPYNMIETNWIDREEGSLGLYFHSGYSSWFYLWIIPEGEAGTSSFVILAESDESLFTPGEC